MRNKHKALVKSMIDNPFLIYGYEGTEYFCDRKEETEIRKSTDFLL